MASLRVVILKPSKYGVDGIVERFRKGFMPNSTVPHLRSMTPSSIDGHSIEVHAIDEYVHTNLDYLDLLRGGTDLKTLVCLVGVQSHQFHRALDLAALSVRNGAMAAIGGPHVMTCETTDLQNRGVAFVRAEAELTFAELLQDASRGALKAVYGAEHRWQANLDCPAIIPPSKFDQGRYIIPMLGLYPARGCPFQCSFCSVIKLAGRRVRSQPVETTLQSLRNAKTAGIRMVMFTSDNFNKYDQAPELLEAMIDEKLEINFFAQCDTQVGKQEDLLALMARAGCTQIFLGVESFDRKTLVAAHKAQNRPEVYEEIVRLCRKHGIMPHFSNIVGFPTQTRSDIDEHMRLLKELAPAHASFYILCPIPGTDQYGEFLRDGLITENNLDRFDTTSLTWRHPNLGAQELENALFDCYAGFYDMSYVRSQNRYKRPGIPRVRDQIEMLITVGYNRLWARNHIHPMSGGIGRSRLDAVADYIDLRRDFYGFELAPLPNNLRLSERDEMTNRRGNAPAPRSIDELMGSPASVA